MPPSWTQFDLACMRRALELAAKGEGRVEPNPMVGCVLARSERILAEGWHEAFGGPHAEVNALRRAASADVKGATAYVTLEPCCHHGKTPPCTDALLEAGIERVVVAMSDPFPRVAGGGLQILQQRGVQVDVGCLSDEARRLNAPYLHLLATGTPWIIAKYAMSLDGKIATHTGHSQWISGEQSRAIVHQLRGRVDAILVGRRTAELDDPLLTARPPGLRTALRVVVDSLGRMSKTSRLVATAREFSTLIAVGPDAPPEVLAPLMEAGCEVFRSDAVDPNVRLTELLSELGRRRLTNVLVEGGSQLLGSLFDLHRINEVHAFIAPKLIGGRDAPSPLGGMGLRSVPQTSQLIDVRIEQSGNDVYVRGRFPLLPSPLAGEGGDVVAG